MDDAETTWTSPLGRLDLSPKPGRLIAKPVNLKPQSLLPAVNQDFDGRIYDSPVAGAYAREGAWRLLIDRKR